LKKIKKNHRKVSLFATLLLATLAIITISIIRYYVYSLKSRIGNVPVRYHMTNVEAENYVAQKISANNISAQYSPVLIYRLKDNKLYFTGSGTYMVGIGSGRQIITAEHLFNTNEDDSPIGVRFVRPMHDHVTELFDKVIFSSKDFNGFDIAIATLTTTSTNIIKNFHTSPKRGRGYVGTADHVKLISGKKMSRLRSVATGKWYNVVGAPMESEHGKALGVCINGFFVEGESGSGFIDEEDNLYVLITVQDETSPLWENMKNEVQKVSSERIQGIGTVVGPLAWRKP